MRSTSLVSAGAVVLTCVLAACSGSASAGAGSATAPASGATTVKIGVDLPVSGVDADKGLPTQNGVVLAVEQANAQKTGGGKFAFVADLLDDAVQGKHDPAAGAQNVKTFIADGDVLAMIGPYNSNVAKSEIPLTNQAGLAQIAPSTTNDGLTIGDDARKLRTARPGVNTFFRVCTRDSRQGAALAVYAKKLGWKSVYVVDDNETYGKGLADVFESEFSRGGGRIAAHEHLTANQQDFKALLTKAKATHPDAVFFGGDVSSGGALLRRQMADVGMSSVPFMGGDGISGQKFVEIAGPAADGTFYSLAAPDAAKLPSASAFVAAYKKRFGADPGPYSANAYTAAKIEIAAIVKTGAIGIIPTRGDVLRAVAATSNFASPIGPIGFDARGDSTRPTLTMKRVEHGQILTVDQITLDR